MLQVGHDGEMIRWPDAVDRGSARQLYRPYFAAAVPGQPDQSLLVSAVPNVSGLWIHFAKVAGVGWLSIGLDRMECPAPRS